MADDPNLHAHQGQVEDYLRGGRFRFGPSTLRHQNGRAADHRKVYTEWVLSYTGSDPLPTFPQFSRLVEILVENEDASTPDATELPDVGEWVQDQLDALQSPDASPAGAVLEYDELSGTWLTGYGMPAPNSTVEDAILTRYYKFRDEVPAVRTLWPKDRIQITLAQVLRDFQSRQVRGLRDLLSHDPAAAQGGAACLRWVLADVLQVEDPDVALAVMQHWLWQVKRYLYNLPVAAPLMVNILGPQGCGKSQFVSMLVGASGLFGSLLETASLSSMGDSRDTDLFSSKFIVFFDELAFSSEYGDDAKNIDAMKKILTSKYNSRRDLGKNSRSKMKRIFSAIAASNTSIVQRIYDPTGMRRYFELVSKRTTRMTTEEHAQVFGEPSQPLGHHPESAMDPLLIWRGIDETRPAGYLEGEVRHTVETIQANYKRVELLEYILREDTGDLPHPFQGENLHSLADMLCKEETAAKARALLEKAYPGLELVRLSAWRKELHDWITEHDKGQARFFPGYDSTVAALAKMRIPVVLLGARQYLITHRVFDDPDEASSPF